jgi:hypothetical protein
MRSLLALLVAVGVAGAVYAAEPVAVGFQKVTLSQQFFAEGAYYGDFNKDGKMDVVIGPHWYEGPTFQTKHEVRPVKTYDPKGYSDNFLTFTADFNGDGWTDIFYVSFPGEKGLWYENPQGKPGHWKSHLAFAVIDNESPMWGDVNGDGRPDLVFNTGGQLGYATWDPAKPDEPWVFHAVTPKRKYHKYTHGIGFGDVNSDGRADVLESGGWWEQPANAASGQPWIEHPFAFAGGAAQMFAYDVDGDGLNDVITVDQCHGYGLLWYKQVKNEKGEIVWQKNVILPSKPDVKSSELRISQMHAVELVDFNGDGLKDILTGKRFWAHGPKGDAEPDAPAVVYWFELQRSQDKQVRFIPHMIDDNSGVGTQVAAADLNSDGVPDVIVGNKKGNFLLLSRGKK